MRSNAIRELRSNFHLSATKSHACHATCTSHVPKHHLSSLSPQTPQRRDWRPATRKRPANSPSPPERKQKPFVTHSVKYNRILAVSRAYCARLNVVMYDNKNTYESLSQNFNTFHSTLSTPQFTLHTSHSTLHTPHFTLDTPHFTLHTSHFTLHT